MASVESESSSPYSKFACILATSFTVRKSEWYAFDVSDDPEHNQSPPPPVAPIYRRYAKYLLAPFHEEDKSDDEHGASFTLKPKATATSDYECCWGILGSKHTLYRIRDTPERDGSRDLEKPNLVDRINLIGGDSKWESVATMPNRMITKHRGLVLNGKLYCLGGFPASINVDGRREEVESKPWAMVYDPTTNVWESIPNPHVVPTSNFKTFSAAVDLVNHKPRILLGAPFKQMLQIYHADTKTWEQQEFVICDRRILHPQDLADQAPLAVDNKLYWYAVDTHCLVGYDLDAKMWFQGYLPMHDHDGYLKDDEHPHRGHDSPPCLGHVGGGENFCLLWVSLLPPTSPALPPIPDNYKSRIHCMKFRVTTGGNPSPDSAVFPLEISILSCQSYLVSGAKEFVDGLVVDGHLGSYDSSSESSQPFGALVRYDHGLFVACRLEAGLFGVDKPPLQLLNSRNQDEDGAILFFSAKFSVVSGHNICHQFEEVSFFPPTVTLKEVNSNSDTFARACYFIWQLAVQDLDTSKLQALIAPAILPRSFLSLQILQFTNLSKLKFQ
ncbi:hypothetical protein Vadar_034097 [Vaccinium darrowii]|uniref:Uncharacterized protein n=1 Tax=Vaccinium darrowii TaxID=229202 RepID=A0ACB7XVH0_9ERIC|nr:hypothetical protein Vadar_034097 [Vaccinium darrowii]